MSFTAHVIVFKLYLPTSQGRWSLERVEVAVVAATGGPAVSRIIVLHSVSDTHGRVSTHLFKEHTSVWEWVTQSRIQTDSVWRQHAQLLLSTVISPSIVWEIPRVQRVELHPAGPSLQQIHKLSGRDLSFNLFPSSWSQVRRIQDSSPVHLPSLLFLAVLSQNIFIFQKMLHLVEITDVTAFIVCLSASSGVSCLSHAPSQHWH